MPERTDVAWMTAGAALIGASGYVFLALAGHGRFTPAASAALAAVYLLSNILGPGLFVAIEQESSRLVSAGLAARAGLTHIMRRTGLVAAGLAVLTVLALAAVSGALVDGVLHSEVVLVLLLALSVVGSAWVFWVRGVVGGQRRFRRYAATLLVDAGVRIVGCGVLAVSGVASPVPYALALCAGPLIAAAVTSRTAEPRRTVAGQAPGWPALIRAVGSLLGVSALAMAIANLSPVIVTAALPDDPALAFGFASALVLTRVPLLLLGPFQALLLPGLSAAATLQRSADIRQQLRRTLTIGAVVLAVGTAGSYRVGRPVVSLLFGATADVIAAGTLALLAGSAGLLLLIGLVQPTLIALGRHTGALGAWILGAVAFGAAFGLPLSPVDCAVVAQLAAPAVTLAAQLTLLRPAFRG